MDSILSRSPCASGALRGRLQLTVATHRPMEHPPKPWLLPYRSVIADKKASRTPPSGVPFLLRPDTPAARWASAVRAVAH